jgi:Amt family ammonium transporter
MQTALCILFLLLAPLTWAGLALVNAGLGRSRNAAHSMMSALCVICVACCVYVAVGHSLQGSAGEPSRTLIIGGKPWDWAGAATLFLGRLTGLGGNTFLVAWMGIISVGLAGLIPLGSGAERWRLSSICASTAILSSSIFPLFAHWAWGGGWLSALGVNYGLGIGYVDVGGTGAIHVIGGFTALAVTWILGPRRGKFGPDGIPTALPGHNVVLTLFGCLLALVGWAGLNAAGATLFAGAEPGRVALIAVNTILGASSSALAAVVLTRVRYGRPDASLAANGWVAGMVATSSACALIPPAAAMIVGLIAGALVTFSVELVEMRLDIDDPAGSVSVHLVAGIWGLLATVIFGRFPSAGSGQLLAQIVGIATLTGFMFPLIWGVHVALNRVVPLRVAREGEGQGMDLFELGAGAYPDFATHNDDYPQR